MSRRAPDGRLFALLVSTLVVVLSLGLSRAVAAPASATCAPRPNVTVTVTPSSAGGLQATVAVQSSAQAPSNQLSSISFDRSSNGLVDLPDGRAGITSGVTVSLAPGTTQYSFL